MVLLVGCSGKWGGWEPVEGPEGAGYLQHLRGRSDKELWAVDVIGAVYQFDGESWTSLGGPVRALMTPDLRLTGERDAFLVTSYAAFHWDGQRFDTIATTAGPGSWFRGAWASSADDLWLKKVLRDGSVTVLRWDGRELRQVAAPTIPSWGTSADDAWGIKDGSVLHWNGIDWQDHRTSGIRAVWGTSKDQAWAVGERETLLQWDGQRWEPLFSKPWCADYRQCATFNGVWARGPRDVWVVGENGPGWGGSAYGAIHHWDGERFTVVLQYGTGDTWNQSTEVGPLRDVFGFTGAAFTHDGKKLLRLRL